MMIFPHTKNSFLKRVLTIDLIKTIKPCDLQHDSLKLKTYFLGLERWLTGEELVALAEDVGLIPNTHIAAHSCA